MKQRAKHKGEARASPLGANGKHAVFDSFHAAHAQPKGMGLFCFNCEDIGAGGPNETDERGVTIERVTE